VQHHVWTGRENCMSVPTPSMMEMRRSETARSDPRQCPSRDPQDLRGWPAISHVAVQLVRHDQMGVAIDDHVPTSDAAEPDGSLALYGIRVPYRNDISATEPRQGGRDGARALPPAAPLR